MLPHQTSGPYTIYSRKGEFQILYVGRAHTHGDASCSFCRPYRLFERSVFDGGSVHDSGYIDWIHALDIVLNLDADISCQVRAVVDRIQSTRLPRAWCGPAKCLWIPRRR